VKNRRFIWGVAYGLLLAGIFFYLRSTGAFHRQRPIDSAAVATQIKRLKELATVRYSIQRVVGLREEKIPFGEESILLMVQGEAIAGVDLASITRDDIRYSDSRSVVIALPEAKLFDTYLDENQIKVWDRHITWWTPWVPYNPDLEHQARVQAISDVRNAALDMGILGQAQRNAETAIRDFLGAFGINATFKGASM
jgi:hypothetical protein